MTAAPPQPQGAGFLGSPAEACPDEARWVDEAAAGNLGAFDHLVQRHHARVYNYLRQLTRSHHDAEDLTQQTFIKGFHALANFDPRRPLLNWLFTIARNLAMNHFRDTRRTEPMPGDAAVDAPSPAEQAETREESENLWRRAQALLPPRLYEILWLRFGEDLSTRETARVVGLTEIHVKVLLHRARQTLLKGDLKI